MVSAAALRSRMRRVTEDDEEGERREENWDLQKEDQRMMRKENQGKRTGTFRRRIRG